MRVSGRYGLLIFPLMGLFGLIAIGATPTDARSYTDNTRAGIIMLSLSHALKSAGEISPAYRAKLMARQAVAYALQAAHRQRFPIIRLLGGYYDSPFQARQLIPGARLAEVPLNERFDQRIGTLGLGFSLPLYEGGRISARTHAATDRLRAADYVVRNTLENLQLSISRVFYTLLVLHQAQRAERLGVRYLRSAMTQTEQYVHAGTRPELDLDRIKARLAREQTILSRIKDEILAMRAQLGRLIGLPTADQVRVRVQGQLDYHRLRLRPFNAYLTQALATRPDYLALESQLEAKQQDIKIAASAGRPQVSLQADYLRYKGFSYPQAGVQPGGSISLNFSWVFFAGGQIQARTNRARAKYHQAQQQLSALRKRVGYQLHAAIARIRTSAAAVQSTASEVHSAHRALQDEALRFKVGEGTVTDLLDTEAVAINATLRHARSLADYRLGWLSLRVHIGHNLLVQSHGQSLPGGND